MLLVSYLIALLLDPKDGSSMFLQEICRFTSDIPENDALQLLYWSHKGKLMHLTEKLDVQVVVIGTKSPFFQDHPHSIQFLHISI